MELPPGFCDVSFLVFILNMNWVAGWILKVSDLGSCLVAALAELSEITRLNSWRLSLFISSVICRFTKNSFWFLGLNTD